MTYEVIFFLRCRSCNSGWYGNFLRSTTTVTCLIEAASFRLTSPPFDLRMPLILDSLTVWWKSFYQFSTFTSCARASSRACTVPNGSSPCSATSEFEYPAFPVLISQHSRFPLDVVFRIYDNVLASGIEALFSFSVALLARNEEALLSLKFDQLLVHLNTKMLDVYLVSALPQPILSHLTPAKTTASESQAPVYDVNLLVQDAVSMNITPFMLDQYANEYAELVRTRDAHAHEMDTLRHSNRALQNQVCVWSLAWSVFEGKAHSLDSHKLEEDLANLNSEHVKILVSAGCRVAQRVPSILTVFFLFA